MNHFEAHLVVSSRVIDSKVLNMAIQFEYFSDKKAIIANVMSEVLHGFSLVWVLMSSSSFSCRAGNYKLSPGSSIFHRLLTHLLLSHFHHTLTDVGCRQGKRCVDVRVSICHGMECTEHILWQVLPLWAEKCAQENLAGAFLHGGEEIQGCHGVYDGVGGLVDRYSKSAFLQVTFNFELQ